MKTFSLIIATAVVVSATPALATSFINGGFETTSNYQGQLTYVTTADGWTVDSGYSFVFGPGQADDFGVPDKDGNRVRLRGPGTQSSNGLTDTSPLGGNFVASSGINQVGSISQVISGLTAGETYYVRFLHAFAQQGYCCKDKDGETQQYWTVSFAGQSYTMPSYTLPSRGFSGWMDTTISFVAQDSIETLSFLAFGTGNNPMSLLDGVRFADSLAGVPEPATWAMLIAGFGMVGLGSRLRNRAAAG